ncbi:Hypothetical protein CINCED_3A018764 [Cinara cedri]|uniref:Uncharacterized protein n=1 Tax=Cinara cedri TaxID=506608 RepID=A0A5E4NRV2_9HEMI|nr:Hypothetical protein CINCED_3A018764 [Cinara cedri]
MDQQILNSSFGFSEPSKLPGSDKVVLHLIVEETPINNMIPMSIRGSCSSIKGFEARDLYKEFFNNEGAVSW